VCASSNQIGMIGSLMFTGLLFGSLFISRLGDIYGRKWILVGTVLVSTLSLLIINLTSSLYTLYGFIFIFGMSAAPRYSISYVYALELVSSEYETFYGMLCMTVDSISMILFGFYFYYIKDMNGILYFLAIIQTAAIIFLIYYVPESPKYLYDKGETNKFF
jgi:MFS family permease